MAKIALVAHYGRIPALLVTSDARFVESGTFAAHFGIQAPNGTPESLEAYKSEFQKIMADHGGDMANLPRAVWNEALITWIKGPEIGTTGMKSAYVAGPDDGIQWTETFKSDGDIQSNLIPDYWRSDFLDQFVISPEMQIGLSMLASAFTQGPDTAPRGGR